MTDKIRKFFVFFGFNGKKKIDPVIAEMAESMTEVDESTLKLPREFAETMRLMFEDHERIRGTAYVDPNRFKAKV